MNYQILQGNCLQTLRTLPAGSVQTCVTSPPYYGLRDYQTATWDGGSAECDHLNGALASNKSTLAGYTSENIKLRTNGMPYRDVCGKCGARRIDNQIGLEETPDAYVAKLVDVFREVRRVLHPTGTIWVNLGDSFQDKQLLGIPWRVAFALQADGWILRSDVIWAKPNPMPESVTDRPTKAHEYIFLLSKSSSYFYDADAVREPNARLWDETNIGEHNGWVTGEKAGKVLGRKEMPNGGLSKSMPNELGRNRRSVWTVVTKPYAGAHFATFPPDLIEPCILAGTSARGCCAECGAPWARVTEKDGQYQAHWSPGKQSLVREGIHGGTGVLGTGMVNTYKTTGWQPTCTCNADVIPCTVLDPFSGSGTTGAVALKHHRTYIGCELNPDYIELSHRRIQQSQPMLLDIDATHARAEVSALNS